MEYQVIRQRIHQQRVEKLKKSGGEDDKPSGSQWGKVTDSTDYMKSETDVKMLAKKTMVMIVMMRLNLSKNSSKEELLNKDIDHRQE